MGKLTTPWLSLSPPELPAGVAAGSGLSSSQILEEASNPHRPRALSSQPRSSVFLYQKRADCLAPTGRQMDGQLHKYSWVSAELGTDRVLRDSWLGWRHRLCLREAWLN